MMLDPTEQGRILGRIATAAAEEGLLVAPIGSTFFLLHGLPRALTKDVDTVVHTADLEVVPMDVLERLGKRLGTTEIPEDQAGVVVNLPDLDATIDLLRGKGAAKKGFLPRDLLRDAARDAVCDGHILWYPIEHVLVMKADAWADRWHRANVANEHQDANERRATIFRADVTSQLQHALLNDGLDTERLARAIGFLKKSRRGEIERLLFEASGGEITLGDGAS